MTLSNKKLGMWICPKCKLNYINKQVNLTEQGKEYIECLSCHNCFDFRGRNTTKEVCGEKEV